MPLHSDRRYLPWGLLLFSFAVALYKAFSLSSEMTGGASLVLRLLLPDFSLLGLVSLMGLLQVMAGKPALRLLVRVALALLVLFYAIHSFVLLALDESASLFDLGRYLKEWSVVWSFFGPLTISVVLVFLLAIFLDGRIGRAGRKALGLLGAGLLAIGIYSALRMPEELQKYSLLPVTPWVQQLSGPAVTPNYTADQISLYRAAAADPVTFIEPKPNIILLIVESLSSINSMKVAGQRDLLGAFDQLAENGVLFRNFFANHAASEGGIISLLSGFPPLYYPTATPLMFDEFGRQAAVISEYRAGGYFTGFLTNADLGFIGLDRYISGLGLDQARGRDEVPGFSTAPRFVQSAPSDRLLYAEALRDVERLSSKGGRPWLLTLATVSTHLPYTHPEGGEDSALAVWAWSLDRLVEFYEALSERGFFENGILLITGDHRHMRPLTEQEKQRYGDSAKARVPLLAIGSGLPADQTDERFFQQSDLLRYLARLDQPGLALSPHPIWVERYNRVYGKVESINRFDVFDEADQGRVAIPVRVSGTHLEWLSQKPGFARAVETKVHAQRSAHQVMRNGDKGNCVLEFQPGSLAASGQTGLDYAFYPGGSFESTQDLPKASIHDRNVEKLGLPPESPPPQSGLYRFRGFLDIERAGLYWFRTAPGNRACLGISGLLAIDQFKSGDPVQGSLELESGLHEVDFWFDMTEGSSPPALQWVVPGTEKWRWENIPPGRFRRPDRGHAPPGSECVKKAGLPGSVLLFGAVNSIRTGNQPDDHRKNRGIVGHDGFFGHAAGNFLFDGERGLTGIWARHGEIQFALAFIVSE